MSTPRTYRVTVRGVFADLDEPERALLRERAPEHDLVTSGFTDAGEIITTLFACAIGAAAIARVLTGSASNADTLASLINFVTIPGTSCVFE